MKAQNIVTGTVHDASSNGTELVQDCGIRANQRASLEQVAETTEVTCGKCAKRAPKATATAKPAPRKFGRQEWSISELREAAKHLNIAGRSTKDGDALLAEIVALAPQYA